MVKTLFIALATLVVSTASAETVFKLEPTQTQFYMGDSISMNFVLYAPDEVLDVEVIKFPEFRGYWSENMILRQGPVQLLPALMQSLTFPQPFAKQAPSKTKSPLANLRRIIVGSYLASSIIGKTDAVVQPMKLLVRRGAQETEFLSEMPEIKILPLPAIPKADADAPFLNAVGRFSLHYESNQVVYRKDEPAVFRVNLQGEGNFSEINDLPIHFPDSFEILTKRTFLQGSSNFAVKTFEFTVVPKDSGDQTIGEQRFLTFNPAAKKYESVGLPPLHFSQEATPAAEPAPRIDFPPQATWTQSIDMSETLTFKVCQILLGLLFISAFAYRRGTALWTSWERSPQYARRQKLKLVTDERKKGNNEGFYQLAYHLAQEIWTQTQSAPARKLLTELETIRFSPNKSTPTEVGEIEKVLAALVKKTG